MSTPNAGAVARGIPGEEPNVDPGASRKVENVPNPGGRDPLDCCSCLAAISRDRRLLAKLPPPPPLPPLPPLGVKVGVEVEVEAQVACPNIFFVDDYLSSPLEKSRNEATMNIPRILSMNQSRFSSSSLSSLCFPRFPLGKKTACKFIENKKMSALCTQCGKK